MSDKMDRQGVRTPADIERKYNLGQITSAQGSSAKVGTLVQQLQQNMNTRFDELSALVIREEQEKTVDITENGTTEVLPDENKVLGKVTVNVDVPSSGGGTEELENLIDNSGVLDSTEGTVEDKVEQLIDLAEKGKNDTLRARLTNTLTEYTITEAFTIGNHAFNGCSNLRKFVAPNLQGGFATNVFYGCVQLHFVDLGRTTGLQSASFNGNHRIETVILRKADETVTLSGAFSNTNSITNPNYAYQCYFYVPKALLEDYKVATNWSNYANRFRAIEDYPEITGGVI
jgi:hypothetical protein